MDGSTREWIRTDPDRNSFFKNFDRVRSGHQASFWMILAAGAVSGIALSGCASAALSSKRSSNDVAFARTSQTSQTRPPLTPAAALSAQLAKLRTELEAAKAANQALRQENLTLAARAQSLAALAAVSASPPSDVADVAHASVEHYLYAKALDSYRQKNASELSRSVSLLLKSHPDSEFADNASWLEADMALERGESAVALRLFEAAIARYPTGNKGAAFWLGKAKALQALHRPTRAKEALRRLTLLYPGSPEARSGEEPRRSGERGSAPALSASDSSSEPVASKSKSRGRSAAHSAGAAGARDS